MSQDFLNQLFGNTEQPVEAEPETPEPVSVTLKQEVGQNVGLPPELIDRLRGDNADELEQDARKLAALLPTPQPELDRNAEARLLAEQALAHAARTRHLLANQPGMSPVEGNDDE